MKILHRVNLDVVGGAENQFLQFLTHPAAQQAFTQEVLVGGGVHPQFQAAVQTHTAHLYSRKFTASGRKLPRWPAWLRDLHTRAILRNTQPDVVMAWSALAKRDLARYTHQVGAKLILREFGAAWGTHDTAEVSRFLNAVDTVVAETHAAKRMLELRWGYRGAAAVCHSGLRAELMPNNPEPKALAPDQPLVLGVAARLVPIKGVCLALHALQQIQTLGIAARLEIAGTGPDAAALQQLAQALGIAADVHFHGLVTDMAQFYQGVQILLHAPLREPFGNVSIEAAAHGCVVIVPRVDGLFETVDEGRTGYRLPATLPLADYPRFGGSVKDIPEQVYDPDLDALRAPHFVDPARFAAAVAELAGDPARYARMSAAAIAHVRTHFDPDRAVRKLIAAVLAAM